MQPDEPVQYRIPPPPMPPAAHPAPGYWSYGAPGYPPPGYPPPGYPPPYGPAPWNVPQVAAAWPHGPGRPGVATAAAVLGFVTGGLTVLASFFFLVAVLFGGADVATFTLALGLPCAAGLIRGGVLLLRRDSATVLSASAVLSIVVLLLALLVGAITLSGPDILGLGLFVALAAVLPILTTALAVSGTVRGWVESLN